MAEDNSERDEDRPRWRAVATIALFIILVVPFFWVIFYSALTNTSPFAALKDVIYYLNSPFIIGLFIVLMIALWIQLFMKYSPRFRRTF